jgi:hypothetical protein
LVRLFPTLAGFKTLPGLLFSGYKNTKHKAQNSNLKTQISKHKSQNPNKSQNINSNVQMFDGLMLD